MPQCAGVVLPGVEQDWFRYLLIYTILIRNDFHKRTPNARKEKHMSRQSGIWERKTAGGIVYYTTLHGEQIRLSNDEEEAKEKFALLTKTDLPGDVSRADEIC